MWFGTNGGLNKYDGSKITVYKNDPNNKTSISDNYITDIYEDANHNLWISTAYALNRFNPVTGVFNAYKLNNTYASGISTDFITDLCGYDKDNLLISTFGGGVNAPGGRRRTMRASQVH